MKTFWQNKTFQVELMQADAPTLSNNLFPRKVLEAAVKTFIPTLGHLDHQQDAVIHLAQVSHQVTKLELVGNRFLAEVKLLTTPNGQMLRALLPAGQVTFAVCGVGSGYLNDDGIFILDEGWKLICVNAVHKDGKSKFVIHPGASCSDFPAAAIPPD